MSQKNVLITGANKSIGFETAREMGMLGYRVWLGSRDESLGTLSVSRLLADGIDARLVILDVRDIDSIRAASERVLEEDGKLDVLINNAGISGAQPIAPSEQDIGDIQNVYDTNVFGPIRVTQAFLPLLKAAQKACVVMVSSGLGSLTWTSDPAHPYSRVDAMGYNSSKSALNAVTIAFSKEFAAFGIRVNAVDPGYTATDFNGHSGYRTVAQATSGIVWLACLDSSAITGKFFFDQESAPW
ncbi:SDR family oxidoreductase [Pseudomonas salomonii]|uniref:NAD(P)-dependent dehydrogenase, short-chain alcohol dehydrogenase family n=1 Tax=Pseudomonas salomonii TaxID=191391 RepID=A0A1H3UHT8_9PSED|nr:SDR family oxidoreductase [Pseudomonas salomonii]NWF11657.1 SDR family oxidoreductase [Pseudomonas salomonii]SDZ61641.1 NAD(P)-dependent dehydrogenase, short-chain alcohol dehydrogenase family [Pseudomonas salomonii]